MNQTSEYGWTPLLVATQNRYYQLGVYLLDHGADPNLANKGGWTPLYIATDNRNIEGGDYPVRKPDMDHLDFIKLLLDRGRQCERADEGQHRDAHGLHAPVAGRGRRDAVPARRAVGRPRADEAAAGSTAPIRRSRPSYKVTPLHGRRRHRLGRGRHLRVVAEGNLEAVKMLLDLGLDVNAQDTLTGARRSWARPTRAATTSCSCWSTTARSSTLRDIGSRDSIHALAGHTWQAGRLRRRPGAGRRAIGDCAPGDFRPAAKTHDSSAACPCRQRAVRSPRSV